jgi:hypothetical protein
MSSAKEWGAEELQRFPLVGRWSAFCSVVCAMCWLVKHVLLFVVAVQLAAPAGWCCRLIPASSGPTQDAGHKQGVGQTQVPIRKCCAQHRPAQAPQPVSANFCCCPKAATLAKSVAAPNESESATESLVDVNWPSRRLGWPSNDRALRYSLQSIDRRDCPRHLELCVWLC